MKRAIVLLLAAGLAPQGFAATAGKHAPEGKPLAFKVHSGYFVSNKFEPKAAESFVVAGDRAAFDKVFGVGMVMRDKSHRLAKDAFKSKLVVAAIKRGKSFWTFHVHSVTVEEDVVQVRYTATARKSKSASYACPLIVSIPKGKYTAVRFVENKKTVKTVAVAGNSR